MSAAQQQVADAKDSLDQANTGVQDAQQGVDHVEYGRYKEEGVLERFGYAHDGGRNNGGDHERADLLFILGTGAVVDGERRRRQAAHGEQHLAVHDVF